MAKPEWGSKRQCQGCGSKFYDLGKTPIVCPECGTEYKEVTTTARPAAPKPEPKTVKPPKHDRRKRAAGNAGDEEAEEFEDDIEDEDIDDEDVDDVDIEDDEDDDLGEVIDGGKTSSD